MLRLQSLRFHLLLLDLVAVQGDLFRDRFPKDTRNMSLQDWGKENDGADMLFSELFSSFSQH